MIQLLPEMRELFRRVFIFTCKQSFYLRIDRCNTHWHSPVTDAFATKVNKAYARKITHCLIGRCDRKRSNLSVRYAQTGSTNPLLAIVAVVVGTVVPDGELAILAVAVGSSRRRARRNLKTDVTPLLYLTS